MIDEEKTLRTLCFKIINDIIITPTKTEQKRIAKSIYLKNKTNLLAKNVLAEKDQPLSLTEAKILAQDWFSLYPEKPIEDRLSEKKASVKMIEKKINRLNQVLNDKKKEIKTLESIQGKMTWHSNGQMILPLNI